MAVCPNDNNRKRKPCLACAGKGGGLSGGLGDWWKCSECAGQGSYALTAQPPGALIGEKLDSSRDGVLRPHTTQPPGPEAVGTAEFERRVEEQGEADARLANLEKVTVAKGRKAGRSGATALELMQVTDLLTSFSKLGPNARQIMLSIGERLAKGAQQYGDFDGPNANRDWDQETYEEHLDALVYQAVKRLRAK